MTFGRVFEREHETTGENGVRQLRAMGSRTNSIILNTKMNRTLAALFVVGCVTVIALYFYSRSSGSLSVLFVETNQPTPIPLLEWEVMSKKAPEYLVSSKQLLTDEIGQDLLDFVVRDSEKFGQDFSVYRIDYCKSSGKVVVALGSYSNENLRLLYYYDMKQGIVLGKCPYLH